MANENNNYKWIIQTLVCPSLVLHLHTNSQVDGNGLVGDRYFLALGMKEGRREGGKEGRKEENEEEEER